LTLFHYKAAARDGAIVEGEMEAGSQEAVIRRLQDEGHVPIRAEAVARAARGRPRVSLGWSRRGVSRRDVETFTFELASMLEAGFPLEKALKTLAGVAERPAVRELLDAIHGDVRGGTYLSSALEARGRVFSPFYVSMVRAGEAAGALDLALARLAEFMERSRELRETVSNALIYPVILFAVALISLMLILGWVVPQFSGMFEAAGQSLPLPTRIVVALGTFFERYWWAVAAALAGGYVYFRRQWQHPEGRLRWDARLLRLPLVSDLVFKIETARFTRTLGTLLHNGVPLLKALGIAKEIVGNQALARGVARVAGGIREGQGLTRPLLAERVLPEHAGQMLLVGEESGRLEEMLLRVADLYEREVQHAVRRLVALLEPTLILTLAVLIGGIILSIVVAILGVNQLGTL